jgi:NTE family protein
MIDQAKSRLFCWSGGGLPGLDIHAGILWALADLGIEPTWNAGTSAGAAIAVLSSAGLTANNVECLIHSFSDSDVRRQRLFWKLRLFWESAIFDPAPVRAILAEVLPDSFRDLVKPCSIHVTRDRDGAEIAFGNESIWAPRDAVLASMAISGIFPPVEIGAELYSDGGTCANLPLPAGWQQADEVWLLVAKRPLDYPATNAIGRLLRNLDLLAEDQVRDTIRYVEERHRCVRVIRPPIVPSRGMMHFDHALKDEVAKWTQAHVRAEGWLP